VKSAVQAHVTWSRSITEIVKSVESGNFDQDIVNFASFLFLHSLAHILKNALAAKYAFKDEDVGYYIEHPKLHVSGIPSGKIRIVLLATAIGGLGYTKGNR